MVRMARAVIVGNPYHITHRGNQRRDVFFTDLDRQLYLADLAVWAHDCGPRIWAYCLMTNHVHLVAVPMAEDAMARAVGRTHQRHAQRVNAANGWTGHLWANRFFSTALDAASLDAPLLDPERPFGAERPHPLTGRPMAWRDWLALADEGEEDRFEHLRKSTLTGRPCGGDEFIEEIERRLGRRLTKLKPGPRPRSKNDPGQTELKLE
jgi:putative transposase